MSSQNSKAYKSSTPVASTVAKTHTSLILATSPASASTQDVLGERMQPTESQPIIQRKAPKAPTTLAAELDALNQLRIVKVLQHFDWRSQNVDFISENYSDDEDEQSPFDAEIAEIVDKIDALRERMRVEGVEEVKGTSRAAFRRAWSEFEALRSKPTA